MNTALQRVGANPTGILGRLAGLLMNRIHAGHYRQIITTDLLADADAQRNFAILDLGCGGGNVIKLFSKRLPHATIAGLDHSPAMVTLSKRTNRQKIAAGRVEIVHGTVSQIPYPNAYFDLITAFDTINFWDDIEAAFLEIRRVLKPGGMLSIVNGYPPPGTAWWNFVKFKTDEDYRAALSRYGFGDITTRIERGTIIVRAKASRGA